MAKTPGFIIRGLVEQLWIIANAKQTRLNAVREHKDYCLVWSPSCDLRNERYHESFTKQSLQYRSFSWNILKIIKQMKVPHYNRAIAFKLIMQSM